MELAKKLVIKELPLGTGSSMLKSIICDAMVQRGLALGEAVTKLEVIGYMCSVGLAGEAAGA